MCRISGIMTHFSLEITRVFKVRFGDFNICFTAAIPCFRLMVINESVTHL